MERTNTVAGGCLRSHRFHDRTFWPCRCCWQRSSERKARTFGRPAWCKHLAAQFVSLGCPAGFPFEEEAEISGVHGTRTACVSPSPDSVPPWIPTRRNCLRFLECSGAERRECQHCQRGPAFCELHSSDPSSKYSSGKYLRRLSTLSADAGIYRMPGVVFFPDCANVIGILAGPLDRLNRWRWNWDRMALDRARLF
jgi:hypothetical protein